MFREAVEMVSKTVRPETTRYALGLGLTLVAIGAGATSASAMTLPAPVPVPAPVPAPAPAPAPPSTESPVPGPPRTLSLRRGDGQRIRVRWPSGHRTVAPASTVPVRIDQPRRGARKLTVRLLRVSAKGRVRGTVQRTGVTRGTVSVAIPDAAGRRYALRLQRGGKLLRQMTIRTPVAAPPAPPAPAPAVPGPGWPGCHTGTLGGQIELGAPSVARGEQLPFAVLNTGSSCFGPVSVTGVERQDGESWTAVPMLSIAVPAIYYVVRPGSRDRHAVGTLADAQPGTYRVTVRLSPPTVPGPAPQPTESTLIQATFLVIAPPVVP